MRYELRITPFRSNREDWWHDYTSRLPECEKYLTGLSWIRLCETGFYIVLISYKQWGELVAYVLHRTASRFSSFVLSLSSSQCLSVSHSHSTSSTIHTEVSILKSALNKSVFLKGSAIINFLSLPFPPRGRVWPLALTKSVNLPWKLHREGTLNYWRGMVDAQEKDKKGNSKLSTRVFQWQGRFECTFLCDKSENLRVHRGDVSASLLLRKNAGRMGARHSCVDLLWAWPLGRAVKVKVTQRGRWSKREREREVLIRH